MNRMALTCTFALIGLLAGNGASAGGTGFNPATVRQFVDDMVTKHDLDAAELTRLLGHARAQPKIIAAMRRPAEAKPWHQYRDLFLTPTRIQGGAAFWADAQPWLNKAEEIYGVPAEIIVGILGVETQYGRHQGKYRVLDALTTLAFNYPERADFFRTQLENFILLVREEHLDALTLAGSYAGAIGTPQFMPSSYRNFAVDFDGDGKKDLIGSSADVIGSVANYFKSHQWRPGQAIIAGATIRGDAYRVLLEQGLKPQTSLANFPDYGVTLADTQHPGMELGALIELDAAQGPEYWVGLQNFYVIICYNHSPLYAMAVYQLAQEVRAQHDVSVAHN